MSEAGLVGGGRVFVVLVSVVVRMNVGVIRAGGVVGMMVLRRGSGGLRDV